MKRTRNYAEILRKELAADPSLARAVAEESLRTSIGQRLFDLREQAAMSHAQLAAIADTTPSMVSRIEDADYDDVPIFLLRRLFTALGKNFEVHWSDAEPQRRSTARRMPQASPKGKPRTRTGLR